MRPTEEEDPAPEKTEPSPDETQAETPTKKRSFWRELPVLIVVAFVIALIVKSFLVQAFYIPSGSMEPSLEIGDRVLVEKVSYRFGDPGRGDVVVFEREAAVGPEADDDDSFLQGIADAFRGLFGFPTGGTQDFIKRVIAVEGDRIEGRNGRVFVNNEEIDEPYLPEGTETSPFAPVEVGADELFVMGDNRGNSDDSRSFGTIPEDSVVGHAFLLVWPPGSFDTL